MYGPRGFLNRVLIATQGRSPCHQLAVSLVEGKRGLEIGGPSEIFQGWYRPLRLYNRVGSLDNCDFSRTTAWSSHSSFFQFSRFRQPGKTIVCDGSNLSGVTTGSYDFVLSSHNLEHFANPVKALKEWQRVLRPGGSLILALPHYAKTFDHRRNLTPVAHMIADFESNTQEDDLSHLEEILSLHDLKKDRAAGTVEDLRRRSLRNLENRCMHHHVFDEHNSRQLLTAVGMEVLAVEQALPFHIFLLATLPRQHAADTGLPAPR
jgi:SAM-dependent methyltransferase